MIRYGVHIVSCPTFRNLKSTISNKNTVEDYKNAHPNYQREIKEDTITETKRKYEEYLAEQKESGSQN